MYQIGEGCPKAVVMIPVWWIRKIQGNPWKLRAGKRYTDKLSNILEEFPAEQRNIPENSCLWIGTLTDLKGFCENSWLGKGISGKIPGFIRETYSRLERVCSVTSWLGAGKATGSFLQCSSAKENFKIILQQEGYYLDLELPQNYNSTSWPRV